MISNSFKGAYQNEVAQQNQGIQNVTGGVKSALVSALGIAGFSGVLGDGAFAQGAEHAFAGRVGGIGGNIMLAALKQKTDSIKENKNTERLFTGREVSETIKSQLGDNPINRPAVKTLRTVFETLANAQQEGTINKKGNIESSIGDIDPNSELGKKIVKELGKKGEDER